MSTGRGQGFGNTGRPRQATTKNPGRRGGAWTECRRVVMLRDRVCHICSGPLRHDAPPRSPWSTHCDHTPRSLGWMRTHLSPSELERQANDPARVKCAHKSCHEGLGPPESVGDNYQPSPTTEPTERVTVRHAGPLAPQPRIDSAGWRTLGHGDKVRRFWRQFEEGTPDAATVDASGGGRIVPAREVRDFPDTDYLSAAEYRQRHGLTDTPMTPEAWRSKWGLAKGFTR